MSTTIETTLGAMTAYEPQIFSHYGTPIVARSVSLPKGGVTINGVTYEGSVRVEVWRGRTYATIDTGMVSRKGQSFSWGTITDSARSKLSDALKEVCDGLVITAGDDEWRREYARDRVRAAALRGARDALFTAEREAREMGADTLVDAMAEARDVLLSLTEADLRR